MGPLFIYFVYHRFVCVLLFFVVVLVCVFFFFIFFLFCSCCFSMLLFVYVLICLFYGRSFSDCLNTWDKYFYTTLINFSTKYLVMCKVYTDVGGIK